MLRAADLGWISWYEPAAVIEHKGGEYDVDPSLSALLNVNKAALYRRRRGPVRGLLYRAALILGLGIRALAGRTTARSAAAALVLPSRRVSSLAEVGVVNRSRRHA